MFIYMSFIIQGEIWQERQSDMNEDERQSVREELKYMVKAWRDLAQENRIPWLQCPGGANQRPNGFGPGG